MCRSIPASARDASGRQPADRLKKIPQRGEFDDLLSRQNGGDQFTPRSGMDLVEMQLRNRLGRELPYAFLKSALRNEVGSGAADTSIVE
jgi:hypothetical protein